MHADGNCSFDAHTLAHVDSHQLVLSGDNDILFDLSQKNSQDISQPGVEPNVYDFVHDKVEALNWERRPEPFNNNGYASLA